MAVENDKAKKFYDALVKNGNKLPDYDKFYSGLQDRNKAETFYGALVKNGNKLPDFDTFYQTFNPSEEQQIPKKAQENPITPELPKEQEKPEVVYGYERLLEIGGGKDPRQSIEVQEEDYPEEEISSWESIKRSTRNTWKGIKAIPQDFTQGNLVPMAAVDRGIKRVGETIGLPEGIIDAFRAGYSYLAWLPQLAATGEVSRSIEEAQGKVAEMSSQKKEGMEQTKEFVKSIRSGDVGGIAAGSVNGVLGYLPSIIVGVGTKGGGFMSYFGGSEINSAAEAKADMNEVSIRELFESEEAEIAVPALTGGIAGALEKYGLAKTQKFFMEGIKGTGKDIVKEIATQSGRQGVINWLEGGISQFNVDYARSGDAVESTKNMTSWLFSEDGLNAGLEASAGTILSLGLGKGAQRVKKELSEKEISEPETTKTEEKESEFKEKILVADSGEYKFVGDKNGFVYEDGGLTEEKANAVIEDLKKKYPKADFIAKDNTDQNDPYADPNWTILSTTKKQPSYTIQGQPTDKATTEAAIATAETVEDLKRIEISNDQELQDQFKSKFEQLNEPKDVQQPEGEQKLTGEEQAPVEAVREEPVDQEPDTDVPVISEQAGEFVTARIGDRKVTGRVEVDEGGKATITEGNTVYELQPDTPFVPYTSPVNISEEGDFVVNGDPFSEARIETEQGEEKALLIREDGTTKTVKNPKVVEEIKYKIALANLDSMEDSDADQIFNDYEQQRQVEETTEEGVDQTDAETEEDRQLRETIEEIELIEEMALEDLQDIEEGARLVEFTPKTMKEPKIYVVKKKGGSYEATLNGRKVARPEIVSELGKLYESETRDLVGELQEQVNQLKQEAEQKLSPKQETKPKEDGTKTVQEPLPERVAGRVSQQGDRQEVPRVKGKGKVPLDQRRLQGPRKEAAELDTFTPQDVASQWVLRGGRLTSDSISKEVFATKGDVNKEIRRRSQYVRKPEKGGISIERAAEQIVEENEGLNLDVQDVRNALIELVNDNESFSQIADKVLERNRVEDPAQQYTQEEIDAMEAFEKEEAKKSQKIEEDTDFEEPLFEETMHTLDTMSDQELREYAESAPVEEQQPTKKEPVKEDKVSFTMFGELKTGKLNEDGTVTGDDGKKYQPSMVDNVQPITDNIESQKEAVKKALDDVKKTFTQGPGLGIQADFKTQFESDKQFYDAIVKLIREYAKLKGMQAADIYKSVELAINKKLTGDDKKIIKGVIDEAKKETPTVSTTREIRGLTEREKAKQGIEEILADKERKAKDKIELERKKAKQAVKQAKDKEKTKLDKFKAIKKTMVEFIKMDLKDIPASNFRRSELGKILTQIDNAKTDKSLDKAIEQAYKVFAEAGQRERISRARGKVSQAKKNVKSGKLGVIEPNGAIDQILRIDPSIVPAHVFDTYFPLLDQLGERKSVLSLADKSQMNEQIQKIIEAVDVANSKVDELAMQYEAYEDKQENYSSTVAQMFKEGIISESEMELMKERKKDIMPVEETTPKTEEEKQAEIDEAVEETQQSVNNFNPPMANFSKEERSVIRTIKSITKDDLDHLGIDNIKRIGRLISNIENGHVPQLSEMIRQKVEGNRSAMKIQPILNSYKGSWFNFISGLKAVIKNQGKKGQVTTTAREKVRRNPLSYIDQQLGNFKNTALYDNTFRKLAKAYSNVETDDKTVTEIMRKAIAKLPQGPSKQFESRAKLKMFAIQKEFDSNPENKSVHSAKEWLEATLNDRNSVYDKKRKEDLQKIFDKYTNENGELDGKKLYQKLSEQEKEAFNAVEKINREMLRPKAMATSTLYRGNRVPILENYVHLPLAVKGGKQNPIDIKTLQHGFMQPSTKSGTLIERTGKVHAISFDFFADALDGARKTLIDYHMEPVVQEMNNTMKWLTKNAETDENLKMAQDVEKIYVEAMTNVFGVALANDSISDQVMQEMIKKGYQASLSGLGRSVSELTSNTIFAMGYKPTETIEGAKIISKHDEVTLSKFVRNTNSAQSSRLYGVTGMDSKNVDFSRMSVKDVSRMSGYDEGVVARLFNGLKNNPAYEFVDNIQSFMVSKPDQLIARPMWIGTFDQEFRNIAGKSPDINKIAEGDSEYIDQHSEAIERATKAADDVAVEAVASTNPFDGILRNQVPPTRSAVTAWWKTFNGFMTRFPTYEYNSAVRGVYGLFNNGVISKGDSAKMLAALNLRLMSYSMMTGTLVPIIYRLVLKTLFDFEPEEEEKEFKPQETLAKEALSGLVMLSINRNIGNVGKVPINLLIEMANKEYGENVTYSGKYDSFSDNIVYPLVPIDSDTKGKPLWQSVVENTSGPLSPHVKTIMRTGIALWRMETSKKQETKDKYLEELYTRSPFEIMGNMGYIPFYKDARKMMLMNMYEQKKNMEKENKSATKYR